MPTLIHTLITHIFTYRHVCEIRIYFTCQSYINTLTIFYTRMSIILILPTYTYYPSTLFRASMRLLKILDSGSNPGTAGCLVFFFKYDK